MLGRLEEEAEKKEQPGAQGLNFPNANSSRANHRLVAAPRSSGEGMGAGVAEGMQGGWGEGKIRRRMTATARMRMGGEKRGWRGCMSC